MQVICQIIVSQYKIFNKKIVFLLLTLLFYKSNKSRKDLKMKYLNKQVSIGKNVFTTESVFSHHIGNVVFYELKPVQINAPLDLVYLAKMDNKLYIEQRTLEQKLDNNQAQIIETTEVEKESVKG